MGLVYAEITLTNANDEVNARRGIIKDSEVREMTLTAMVDTGAWTLAINEEICKELGLEIAERRASKLANGEYHTYGMTEAVKVQWKNRNTICQAIVLPGSSETLLGAIPLEGMDLMVDPLKLQLVGTHGEEAIYRI